MMPPLEHLRMVQDRAAGIPSRLEAFARSRGLRFTEPGFDRAVWRQMCAKGWLGLCIPRQTRRPSHSVQTLCNVAEELGASLAPEPLIAGAMAAALLPASHLAEVLSGDRIVLPAWQETPKSLAVTGATELRAGRLTGRKISVPMASGADAYLVTLPDGLALLDRDAPGLALDAEPTQDGGHGGTLTFADAPAQHIEGDATDALDQMIVATAAYLLGLVGGVVVTTFSSAPAPGDPAHQLYTDMQTQLSLTRAVVRAAAIAMDRERHRPARQAAVSRAMLRAADAAITVTRHCVQHQGAAVKSDVDLFRRKAMVLAALYGAPAAHSARCRAAAGPAED